MIIIRGIYLKFRQQRNVKMIYFTTIEFNQLYSQFYQKVSRHYHRKPFKEKLNFVMLTISFRWN